MEIAIGKRDWQQHHLPMEIAMEKRDLHRGKTRKMQQQHLPMEIAMEKRNLHHGKTRKMDKPN